MDAQEDAASSRPEPLRGALDPGEEKRVEGTTIQSDPHPSDTMNGMIFALAR